MNVDLNYAVRLECDDGIADGNEERLESLYVKIINIAFCSLKLNEKLGAISVGHNTIWTEACNVNGRCRLWRRSALHFGNILAVKYAVKTVYDIKQTCSARVNDACLLKNRKGFGSAVNRSVHFLNKIGKKSSDSAFRGDAADSVINRFARHGKDSSLHRRHNRGISSFNTGPQRLAEGYGISLWSFFKILCNSRKELGKNNARIASRAEKHTLGRRHHNACKAVAIHRFESGNTAFDSHTHVIARVTVGNGEYVKLVNGFSICAKLLGAAPYHFSKKKTCKIFEAAGLFFFFCAGLCLCSLALLGYLRFGLLFLLDFGFSHFEPPLSFACDKEERESTGAAVSADYRTDIGYKLSFITVFLFYDGCKIFCII